MRRLVFALLVVTTGCNNHGWGSLSERARELCASQYDRVAADLQLGSAPKAAFLDECAAAVTPALSPCTEHKYGSDSALLCLDRRVGPAMSASVARLIEGAAGPDPLARRMKAERESATAEFNRTSGTAAAQDKSGVAPSVDDSGRSEAPSDQRKRVDAELAELQKQLNAEAEANRQAAKAARAKAARQPAKQDARGPLGL